MQKKSLGSFIPPSSQAPPPAPPMLEHSVRLLTMEEAIKDKKAAAEIKEWLANLEVKQFSEKNFK